MDKEYIRILLIEDDEDDYALVRELLSEVKFANFILEWVQTYHEGLKELCRADHDAYLLDYRLGSRNGIELIRKATEAGCDKPIIFLTGQVDYEVDMGAMRSGGADYLVKAQLTSDMLERSIRYSIARKEAERELKRYRNRLEDLVKQRTEQLEMANEKLRVEIAEHKQAEEALRVSEVKHRGLYESLRDAFGIVDMEGRIKECNGEFCRMLGYSPEDIVSLTYKDITPTKWHPFEAEIIERQVITRGHSEIYEKEYRRKDGTDGTVFPVELRTFLLRDDLGIPFGMGAIIRDITERKKTEAAIAESMQRLRIAMDLAKLVQWEYGVESGMFRFDEQFYAMCGTTSQHEGGSLMSADVYVRKFIPPEEAHLVAEAITKTLATTDPNFTHQLEHRIIRATGEERHIIVRYGVVCDQTGRVVKIRGANQDVTERKRVEEALRESEEKFRNLFNNAGVAMFRSRLDGSEILDINEKFLKIVGKTRSEAEGTPSVEFWADVKERDAMVRTLLAKGLVSELEFKMLNKHGEVRDSIASLMLYREQGIVEGTIIDVTERKRAEDELRVSLRFLEIVHKHTKIAPLLKEYVAEIKNYTGCDAVGIRVLDENLNIPYEAYQGFSKEFYKSESPLSLKTDECMCINVLRGDVDPSLPFYTEGGGFCANATSRFLATVSEEEKGRTRNRCNKEGYETVALFPFRSEGEILGLIHVADHRENMVPPNVVKMLEKAALQLGTAFQRARAESRLQESEEFKKAIIDSVSSQIAVLDGNGVIESVNEPWTRFYVENSNKEGITTHAGLGANYLKVCLESHGESSEGAIAAHDGILAVLEGSLPSFSFEYPCHSQSLERWFTMVVTPLGTGERGVVISHANITERKLAEQKAVQLAAIVQYSDDAIIGKNLNGIITSWNLGAAKIYGYTESEIIGKPISILSLSEQQDEVLQILERVKSGECIEHYETLRQRKDGRNIWMSLTVSPVRNAEGTIVAVSTIGRDITERKLIEEEKVKLEAELRQAQKLEAIGTLAGGIAHDFNNILQPIIGYTEMALNELSPSSPLRDDLGQVINGSLRAKELVRQILAVSRATQEQQRVPIDVSSIIKEALKLLRSSLPASIEIRQKIRKGSALADSTQIHQVLMNLCTNAAYAMDDKGILEVRLSSVDLSERDLADQSIVDLKPGPYLRLTISDTGCGMDAKTMERIFEPYFTTKEVGRGSGLGLAVVNGIVKRHEGAVTIRSEPGKGTTFSIYIPRVDAQAETTMQVDDPLPRGSERVLLVDDEPTVVQMGSKLLERLGYKVTGQTDSVNALEVFRSSPDEFDLIITDYTMPKLTGVDLAVAIHQIRPEIPIILCTGFSERVTETVARGLGVELIMKPFGMKQLARLVSKLIDARESA